MRVIKRINISIDPPTMSYTELRNGIASDLGSLYYSPISSIGLIGAIPI
jgi:hypothetical protein